ncbi:hypothetical protein [Ruegeria arenilitoris]|uniref:Uncharacterized protein n=1 Tax=Ruegeria arenilitoris TaxID=1173585 RepID=A0A238KFX4_9RHOB|nr:hypothetical protein [Ruegeria arenilitoris]SMX41759.1 hypothetical protein RUA8715_02093 [Ruegeria arenilitoris]
MKHDEFTIALWELCDDIAKFPTVEARQVERLRQGALVKANLPAKELLAECLANAVERERIVSEFYEEVIASGLVRSEELHEERRPSEGMDADLWRMQYFEDRIHRYGLTLLLLQRSAGCDDNLSSPQCERKPQNRYCGRER